MMMPVVLMILLFSTSGCLANEPRMEPEYSPASPMHGEPMYASASELSPYPQHLDLETLKSMPVVILHPRTPIKLNMVRGQTAQDVYKSLTPERIMKLLKSAASSYSKDENSPAPKKVSTRQAKNLNFGSSQPRSVFSLPFGDHQRFLPSGGNLFSRPLLPQQTGGWQQRFRNSFSNMFSFAKPFSGMAAATNNPVFMPSPQHGFQVPGPLQQQQVGSHPIMWNPFQPPQSLGAGDFSTAASFAHPSKLQLGSYFNPYHHSPMHQQQQFSSGDLAMSGAAMIPHRVPAPNHAFAHYVSTVPPHKPLFNNIGTLKAASYDIRNAFADFTESQEHGPEVSQKFGSVGHVMNKFLDMMGLGAGGGITDDGEGNFGGAGNWASMDSTPISRSLDFYQGYGNQAHLDDIDDFPIFLEDITEQFLTKMNLTHLLKNETKTPVHKDVPDPNSKKDAATDSKSSSPDAKEKSKDSLKMKEKPASKEKTAKPDAGEDLHESLYVPAHTLDMMQNKNKGKGSTSKDESKLSPDSNKKKGTSSEDSKKISHSATDAPVANYNVPSSLSTVAPQDRMPPVAVFSSFPSKSNNVPAPVAAVFSSFPAKSNNGPAPPPPSYSPAMPLPQHEFEDNPNKLVDEDSLRPWVPVTNGRGYVEKRPRPFVDITKALDQPRSLKIVEQVVSGSTTTH